MGRPSLAELRIAQIVEAASRCIAANGYQGATLERIAAEAGFRRGHIRHYVGNRAELIDRVVDALTAPYDASLNSILRIDDPSARPEALLDHLFGPDWGPSDDTQVFTALLLGAEQDPNLRERMHALYERHHRAITRVLRSSASRIPAREAEATSYAILCLAYGNTVMRELAVFDLDPIAARTAAANLINALTQTQDSSPPRKRGTRNAHDARARRGPAPRDRVL